MQNGSGEKGFLNVIKVFSPCMSYQPLKKLKSFKFVLKET